MCAKSPTDRLEDVPNIEAVSLLQPSRRFLLQGSATAPAVHRSVRGSLKDDELL